MALPLPRLANSCKSLPYIQLNNSTLLFMERKQMLDYPLLSHNLGCWEEGCPMAPIICRLFRLTWFMYTIGPKGETFRCLTCNNIYMSQTLRYLQFWKNQNRSPTSVNMTWEQMNLEYIKVKTAPMQLPSIGREVGELRHWRLVPCRYMVILRYGLLSDISRVSLMCFWFCLIFVCHCSLCYR